MSRRKKQTNPVLFIIVILFCLVLGVLLTRSSAKRSSGYDGTQPDMFVAVKEEDSSSKSQGTVTDDDTGDPKMPEAKQQPTAAPVPSEEPVKKKETKKEKASPEASKGVWTSSGSSWMFLVDGTPYTGWLIDTDGHHYFFDPDGIMQTGWIDDGGKKYYLDLDGIMQTGEVTIDKEKYVFQEDGSLIDDSTGKIKKETEDKTEDKTEEKTENKTEESTGDSKKRKMAALTFDDGPSSFTDRLLDCLEANNAKATFFLVGEEASYFPEQVKRIDSLGCEIGNHSYSHTDFTTLDSDGIVSEISRTDDLIMELTGHTSTLLRPPYGAVNDTVISLVTSPMILWSIDTEDWETLDAQKTVDNVLSQVEDGSIVLMHDIYSQTVDAAEIIIPRLIKEGYELVTVSELAKAHEIDMQAGGIYSHLR